MKIKTNLSPGELKVFAKGLAKTADRAYKGHYHPENPAEIELNRHVDAIFEQFTSSLSSEFKRILLPGEDK